jgi:prepilin-type N-terminal cleavage/methylation domain-containing protein/prepilin-type processing-associated H-X9-DG protein
MRRAPVASPAAGPSGFSLIEILVVITIIGLLMTIGFGPVQNALESGKVTKCKKNLQDMGQSMLVWKDQQNKGRWPKEGGIRFLLKLHKAGLIAGNNSETFLCPGTPDDNNTGASGKAGSSYEDWENIDPNTISYAGRDIEAFPIKSSDTSTVVIGADDNDGRGNHKFLTNVLYADGHTESFDIKSDSADEIRAAFPDIEKNGLPVGPDSPWEPLRVLRID